MARYLPFFSFLLFLLIFFWPVWLKGYLVGPFDFLIGSYYPFSDLNNWPTWDLKGLAINYHNYLMSDVVSVILPVKLYAIELLKQGILPLWNPHILNGSPLLANIQSAIFYPINLLYFVLDYPTAYNLYVISQIILGFWWMWLFLRRIGLVSLASYFGAISFTFCSYMIVWFSWGTIGHSLVWLPLVLYGIESYLQKPSYKSVLIITFSLVLSMFAGHTQTTIMVYLISGLYILAKTYQAPLKLSQLLLLILLSVGISSIQTFPAMEMYQQSVRDLVATKNFYQDQTLFFDAYLTAIFPNFFGNPVTRNWWGKINFAESAIYFGTIGIFFVIYALVSLKKLKNQLILFWLSISLLSILLSTQNIFSEIVFNLKLPLISSSTFSRYSAIHIFSGIIIASLGFSLFLHDIKDKHSSVMIKTSILTGLFLLAYLLVLFTFPLPPEYSKNIELIKRSSILPILFLAGTVIVGNLATNLKIISPLIAGLIILIFLQIELFRFGANYLSFSPREFFYPSHPLFSHIEGRYDGVITANINTYYSIPSIEGSEPLYNKQLAQLYSTSKGLNQPIIDRASLRLDQGPNRQRILNLLSVENILYRDNTTPEIYPISNNTDALPRQKLFFTALVIEDKKALAKLIDPNFQYLTEIILNTAPIYPLTTSGSGTIDIIQDQPNQQIYRVITDQPAILQVTDIYYPGWKAYLNSQEVPILKSNYAFRAVSLPKGNNHLEFQYQPTSLYLGIFVSAISVGLLLLFCFKVLNHKHRSV